MDRVKSTRTPLRSSITRTVSGVDTELDEPIPDQFELTLLASKLTELMEQVSLLDQKIFDLLMDGGATEQELDVEFRACEEYRDKVKKAKLRIEKAISPLVTPAQSSVTTPSENGSTGDENRKIKTYKLPKIELKKFSGDLKEWLGFWSQFSKIHEDPDLHDSDKLQYLVQNTVEGSRARKLVESYPQSAENYQKVIDALKDRFGDKVLLTEMYVRELLKLGIANSQSAKNKFSLASMYDELESHLRALETLDVTTEQSAVFLYPMVESSLPEDVVKVWQRSPLSGYDNEEGAGPIENRLKQLMKFLRREVKGEERLSYVKSGIVESQPAKQKSQAKAKKPETPVDIPTAAGLYVSDAMKCCFCSKNHESKECGKAQSMSLSEKEEIIKSKDYCYRCLKPNHRSKSCKAFVKCPWCSKTHVPLMCPEIPSHKSQEPKQPVAKPVQTTNSALTCSSKVILKTLMVQLSGPSRSRQVRALIDDGSQRSYVLKSVVDELGITSIGEEQIIHSLFSGVQTAAKTHKRFQLKLKNVKSGYSIISVLDEARICGSISRVPRGPWLEELKQKRIWITDVGEGSPEIELLLGADIIGSLMTGTIIQLQSGLTCIETVLGWTLMGKAGAAENESGSVAMIVSSMSVSSATVEDLWRLETIGIQDPAEHKSKQEKEEETKEHFLNTVARSSDGRYCVALPWINGEKEISDNRYIAEKRLATTTRKLIADRKYKDYNDIFNSWIHEGIIEEVPEREINKPSHYLPHRAVYKPESLTTPIRPVFDASCKSDRSPSLNECLEKGPNLLELLPSILLRFRRGKIGVISDIRKAFLMIEVREEDRNFLRFLWWEDYDSRKYKVLRHKRVVFGVNCSPFLLGAVIEFHLKNFVESDMQPLAEKLSRSLYVDNCVTSVETMEEYEHFKQHSTKIMADAKMDLRMWHCSSGELSGIGQYNWCGLDTDTACTQVLNSEVVSVLGLKWNTKKDTLNCDFTILERPDKITKRKILSCVQKIFDPIGYLSPVLLYPKILLQELWAVKLGWDEDIPEEMKLRFLDWCEDLGCLQKIEIPRNVTGGVSENHTWQLHVFGDASMHAYASVVFLRTTAENGISVQLLLAKSRVSPLKIVSIPRLELLACTISARLAESVKSSLSLEDIPTYFWSDSKTALSWIMRNDEWGTFVGNRVREICKLTRVVDWRYVPGELNPADLPSRGCSASKLLSSKWWEGPSWLKLQPNEWPSNCVEDVDEEAISKEKKKSSSTTQLLSASNTPWYLVRSSYRENILIISWMRRFINNFRFKYLKKGISRQGRLTVAELDEAEKILVKLVQNETIPPGNVVSGIRVQRDDEEILRVRTKLLYRDDTCGFRLPMLLPHNHPLVDQIILEEHILTCHSGVQFVMGKLREKFWILQGRKDIRRVLQNCVICRRFTTQKPEVVPAPLPEDRVKSSKAFEAVGVDLAGPLFLKSGEKVWIVLYTCAVYRCVHLELVKSLSTEAFLDSFSTFCNRRGRPTTVFSDNGTNFVGADNLFKKIDWEKVEKDSTMKRIHWKFSPPSGAWWGGWWERLIRTIKDLLRRILGKAKLTEDKMRSYLCEVEATINGRPLTTVTEDPDDLTPLTPAMFLHDLPNYGMTDLDLLDGSGFQKLFYTRKKILDDFKMRFRKEYLSLLVQRGKEKKCKEFKVGDVVLIGSDNRKRWEWPLAKILELIPGKDGHVRVVKLKTASGVLVRPVQRLYALEISSLESPVTQDKSSVIKDGKVSDDDSREDEITAAEKQPLQIKTRSGRTVKNPDRLSY